MAGEQLSLAGDGLPGPFVRRFRELEAIARLPPATLESESCIRHGDDVWIALRLNAKRFMVTAHGDDAERRAAEKLFEDTCDVRRVR